MCKRFPIAVAFFFLAALLSGPPATRAGSLDQALSFLPSSGPTIKPAAGPLLTSGDGQSVWILRPIQIQDTSTSTPTVHQGFMLLEHGVNQKAEGRDLWRWAQPGGGRYLLGTPAALAVWSPQGRPPARDSDGDDDGPTSGPARSQAFVVFDTGKLVIYSATKTHPGLPMVPAVDGQVIVAAATPGADTPTAGTLLVLARHPIAMISEPKTPSNPPQTSAFLVPTTQKTPETTPKSTPNSAQQWEIYRFGSNSWRTLPSPGPANGLDAPSPQAQVTLSAVGASGQACLAWVEPGTPQEIRLRTVPFAGTGVWSKVTAVTAPEKITRLMAAAVDPRIYLFWPVAKADKTAELHAMALQGQGDGVTASAVFGLDLGAAAEGVQADRDIAVARSANSLGVVIAKGKELQWLLFDGGGQRLAGPAAIEPQEEQRIPLPAGFLFMVLTALLLVALWHWRTRPMTPRLPADVRFAPLGNRLLAAGIDMVIPAVVLIPLFHLYTQAAVDALAQRLAAAATQPEAVLAIPEVLAFWGLYLGHVIVGEFANGRSVGKALLGLRVLAIDGTRPTLLAVVLRNLLRVPEMLFPVLLLYVLLNEPRQRLGDLLARTVVVVPGEEKAGGGEG